MTNRRFLITQVLASTVEYEEAFDGLSERAERVAFCAELRNRATSLLADGVAPGHAQRVRDLVRKCENGLVAMRRRRA